MNLESIFENIENQNVPMFTVIMLLLISVALIIFLSGFSLYLYRKVKDMSKMRYGFGGKPIFSILLVLGIALAIPLTYKASQTTIDYVKYASAKKDVLIEIVDTKIDEDLYEVSFIAIPRIDGESWKDKNFDIRWKISGAEIITKTEKKRNVNKPSFFTKDLPPGVYIVEVLVEGDDFYVSKVEEFTLE